MKGKASVGSSEAEPQDWDVKWPTKRKDTNTPKSRCSKTKTRVNKGEIMGIDNDTKLTRDWTDKKKENENLQE